MKPNEKPEKTSVKLIKRVAELSQRIEGNRELTREVANLLFHAGEKPTANRVLQLTRRGSMVTVNDEMNKWWDELRTKLDVRLVNPNVPAPLLEKQADVVGQMWDLAMAAAQSEMQAYRDEADMKVAAALESQATAEAFASEARAEADKANARREETERSLAAERAVRTAAEADVERWRIQAEASSRDLVLVRSETSAELERARTSFAAELESQRTALALAEDQFNDMRKQSLLEIDGLRIRQAETQDSLKQAELGIARLQESERTLKEASLVLQEKLARRDADVTRLTGETSGLTARLEAAIAERDGLARERAEDRSNHLEAIAARDMFAEQLNSRIASMERTETLLREDIERLRSEIMELRAERDLALKNAQKPRKN